jgi:hypothetical protein
MARRHVLYIIRADLPDRAAHQAAIDALKIKLTIDDGYAPFEHEGYLPCTLEGEDAGFDIRFAGLDKSAALPPALASTIEERDATVSCKWSSDPREKIAAFAFGAALAQSFGALVHDPDADRLIDAATLLKQARTALEEI